MGAKVEGYLALRCCARAGGRAARGGAPYRCALQL